jgi:hypothetical protein
MMIGILSGKGVSVRIAIGAGLTLVVLIASPLALLLIGLVLPLDWNALNQIGQSYTGVAAVVSAFALAYAVAAVRIQVRQVTIAQQQAVRDMNFALNTISLTDPELSMTMNAGLLPGATHSQVRQAVHLAMWFRFLELGLSQGVLSEERVRVIVRDQFLANEPGKAWWTANRSSFLDFTEEATVAMAAIMESEYRNLPPAGPIA